MIDVVFLLLIFFVWTSSFEIPEFDLPSAIAESPAGGSEANVSETPPVEVFDEIVIKLFVEDARTLIEFNGERMANVAELRDKVTAILQLGVQPPVIVDPADRVTMDRAIEVYDAVRMAGADRVLFAVQPGD
jgi:biopolymer transport protein ExbD